jgi:hypothetical protein
VGIYFDTATSLAGDDEEADLIVARIDESEDVMCSCLVLDIALTLCKNTLPPLIRDRYGWFGEIFR